jgi:hypothetical protein
MFEAKTNSNAKNGTPQPYRLPLAYIYIISNSKGCFIIWLMVQLTKNSHNLIGQDQKFIIWALHKGPIDNALPSKMPT